MPHPALIPLHGVQDKKPRFLEREAMIVGRARGCDIGLDAPDISNLHCVISRGPEGYRIRDCCSRAGTKINGVSIKAASLHDGDVLQIGPFSFTLQIPEAVQQGRSVDPIQVEHWKRSRKNLAKQALRLRRHLTKMTEKGICHTPSELQKKAAELKERIHTYDKRHSELEQAERELVAERDKLRKEREEQEKHIQTVEKEMGCRLEEVDDQIHQRWQDFQQRCKQEENQLTDALRTLPKSEVNRITSAAQAELQVQREQQARQAQKLREEQEKIAQAKQQHEQEIQEMLKERQKSAQARQELERETQKLHAEQAEHAQAKQQMEALLQKLHEEQRQHAQVKQELEVHFHKLHEQEEQLNQLRQQAESAPKQPAGPSVEAEQLAAAQQQLESQNAQLSADKEQLAQVKKKLEDEARRLMEEQEQLALDNKKLEDQLHELDETQEKLDQARERLDGEAKKLRDERDRLEKMKREIEAGAHAHSPSKNGDGQLGAEKEQLAQVKKKLEKQAHQLLEEQQQLAEDAEQLESQLKKLDLEQEELEDARKGLDEEKKAWELASAGRKPPDAAAGNVTGLTPPTRQDDELKAGLAHVEASLEEQRQSLALMMAEMAKIHQSLHASRSPAGRSEEDRALLEENAQLHARVKDLEILASAVGAAEPKGRDRSNDNELLRHLQLLESEESGLDPVVQAKFQADVERLTHLVQDQEKEIELLKKQATPIAKGTLRESDLENYETELNQYRRQLETDREKLNTEIEQLRERNVELNQAVREMEMEMSRERAELARERTRLDRMREEVRIEMERMQRDGPVRESLASVQKLREEMNQRKQPGGANPLNDRLKNIRTKLTD